MGRTSHDIRLTTWIFWHLYTYVYTFPFLLSNINLHTLSLYKHLTTPTPQRTTNYPYPSTLIHIQDLSDSILFVPHTHECRSEEKNIKTRWRAQIIFRHPTWTHLDRPLVSPWALRFFWSSSSAWVASSHAATTGTSSVPSVKISQIQNIKLPIPHPTNLSFTPRYV